jgi:hypothetical protein
VRPQPAAAWLLLLAAAAPAEDVAAQVSAIDAAQPRLAQRSRMLLGTAPEGASVEAFLEHGAYRKIVVEALGEAGRTISVFYFAQGVLLRAEVRVIGYPGHPAADLARIPPHRDLEMAPGDMLLGDDVYDFQGGALLRHLRSGQQAPAPEPGAAQAVQAQARSYVALMQAPGPPGHPDEGAWRCLPDGHGACGEFRPE